MVLQKLKETRMAAGITQAELAGKVNVSGRTIYNYENGQRVLQRVAKEIARALRVKLEDLK